MNLGTVVGTIVCNSRNDGISGAKYLLVEKSNEKGEKKGDYLVALDLVGAGYNELVLLAEGSSARETAETFNKPMDAIIVGIVDRIEAGGQLVYIK